MKKYCHSKSDVPTTPHYAIVEFSSTPVNDDGYGHAGSVESNSYVAYDNKQEWESDIDKMVNPVYSHRNDKFVAMHVSPATFKVSTSVHINLEHSEKGKGYCGTD